MKFSEFIAFSVSASRKLARLSSYNANTRNKEFVPRIPNYIPKMTCRILIFLIAVLIIAPTAACAAKIAPVIVLHIDGQIDPATADYLRDRIRNAEQEAAQAVLIITDTPGGSIDSTKAIVKSFFASKLPIIVFVSPDGAWAASAGAFVTMAADVAAMVPVSNIGSSSPVSGSPGQEGKDIDPTMKKKVFNAVAEFAKSIAMRRGRNAKWAGEAVREAANLTSADALKQHVIDLIADNVPDLMKKLDGRKVEMVSTGKTVVLHTRDAPLEDRPMGAWDSFLHFLSNPLVALFLTMAAMYGIIYELGNPGSIFPGVIGAISIILLLYSYSVIPINTTGFAFIGLAIVLFLVDLFTPTHGILTVGGVASLFFGLMMLFRSSEGFMVSVWVLAAVAVITGAFFLFVIGMGVRAMRNPYVSGREGVVGHIGEARSELDPTGEIFVDGALWSATSTEGAIAKGEQVEVTEMSGLKLTVRRYKAS